MRLSLGLAPSIAETLDTPSRFAPFLPDYPSRAQSFPSQPDYPKFDTTKPSSFSPRRELEGFGMFRRWRDTSPPVRAAASRCGGVWAV